MKRYWAMLLLASCACVSAETPAVIVDWLFFNPVRQQAAVQVTNRSLRTLTFSDEVGVQRHPGEASSQVADPSCIQIIIELQKNQPQGAKASAFGIVPIEPCHPPTITHSSTARHYFYLPEEVLSGEYAAVVRLELDGKVLAREPLTVTVTEPDAELSKLLRIEEVRFDVKAQRIKARVWNGLSQTVCLWDEPEWEMFSEFCDRRDSELARQIKAEADELVAKLAPASGNPNLTLTVTLQMREGFNMAGFLTQSKPRQAGKIPVSGDVEWEIPVSGFSDRSDPPDGTYEVIALFKLNGKLAARVPLTMEVKHPPRMNTPSP